MYEVRTWPAEWSVLAYVAPGLPMLQMSRGTGLPGGIARARDWGIEVVSAFGGAVVRDLRFGGLLGGLAGVSVSEEDVSDGVGRDCAAFFCLRRSRLFRPARRFIASLLRYSVAGTISGSASGGFVGLTTCARVDAIDIAAPAGGLLGLVFEAQKERDTLLIRSPRPCL